METSILGLWSPDNGDDYALVQDLATMADDIEQSILNPPYVRLTGTGAVSMSSTNHAFQIGPTTGLNLIADNNEIMVRNAGDNAALVLQNDGGDIRLGNTESQITIPGRINSAHTAWAEAAGIVSVPAIPSGDVGTVSVTFPSGRFTLTPVVTLGVYSAVPHLRAVGYSSVTPNGFTLNQYNGTGSSGSATAEWHAVQITPGSAPG